MQKYFLIFVASFLMIKTADQNETVTLSFVNKLSGQYDISVLRKSQTLSDLFNDMGISQEPINLPQIYKQTFDNLYQLMKMTSTAKTTSFLSSKNTSQVTELLEVADFLDIPQTIINVLAKRLSHLITTPEAMKLFIMDPDAFLSKFNNSITDLLTRDLHSSSITQKELLKIALDAPPFTLGGNNYKLISILSISPQNMVAIGDTGNADGSILIFDLKKKDVVRVIMQKTTVWAMNFSPDGNQLITASKDRKIYLWDVIENKLLNSSKSSIDYNRDMLYRTLVFSDDNKYLMSSRRDHSVRIIESSTGRVLSNPQASGAVTALDCSSNGYLAVASIGKIELLDLASLKDETPTKPKTVLTFNTNNIHRPTTIRFSRDNKRIAVAFTDRSIQIYRLIFKDNDVKQNMLMNLQQKMIYSQESYTQSLDFSPDNRWLTSHDYRNKSDVWDLSDGTILKNINVYADHGSSLFSPDGTFLVESSQNKLLTWDLSITKEKDRCPLGTLLLLHLFSEDTHLSTFDKSMLEEIIDSQLSHVKNQKDRENISNYFARTLKLSKLFKK